MRPSVKNCAKLLVNGELQKERKEEPDDLESAEKDYNKRLKVVQGTKGSKERAKI